MRKANSAKPLTHTDVDVLNAAFRAFIERLQRRWLRYNNHTPEYLPFGGQGLYELDPRERSRADGVIRAWEEYVTPFAEKWWKRHGCGVIWPEKSSEPCKIYQLDAA